MDKDCQLSNNLTLHSICLGLNIQGMCPNLRSKSFWKLEMLKEEILILKEQSITVPFIAVTESWIKPHISDGQLHITNYNIYRADRKLSKNGGVLVYVHESIIIDFSSSYDDDICSAVICISKSKQCFISCVYRPPSCSDNSFLNVIKFIENFIHKYNNLDKFNIFIFGDFNFPSIKWGITSCGFPKYLSTSLEVFKNFIDESFLSQYIHDYTRNSNILDLFLTDNPNFVQLIKIDTIPYSDHNLVKIFTTYFSLKETISCNRVEDHHNFSTLNLNISDWSRVNSDFSCLDWDKIVSCPLNDFPDVFRNTVFEILSKHCKINTSKQNSVL